MKHKPDKGFFGGSCNREACQAPGADYYNRSTRRYYCRACAHSINRANADMTPEVCVPAGGEITWDGQNFGEVLKFLGRLKTGCTENDTISIETATGYRRIKPGTVIKRNEYGQVWVPWPKRDGVNVWHENAAAFVALYQAHPEAWHGNMDLKYLTVRIDNRSGHFKLYVDSRVDGGPKREIQPDHVQADIMSSMRRFEGMFSSKSREVEHHPV
jgi:hypothetical protein